MGRRKAVAAVEKDEEVRVTRSTRSRTARAAQQVPPSLPPPPAPRGRTTAKATGRKRKPSVSSDGDDELATKKANIRTSPSPAPPVNRGRKATIKNTRGRRKAITSPTVSGSNSLGDEVDVEGPEGVGEPPVKTEHESSQDLPMEGGRGNIEVEAEMKKPKTRKVPTKKRGIQKKVAAPGSGIRGGKKAGWKFDGPQIEVEVEPEMSATDDADDGEASPVASSMFAEDKTDTPPSSFMVQEDSNRAIEDAKAQAEEPEKVEKAPARKRGAKKVEIPPGSCRRGRSAGLEINKTQMEVASEPAELKIEPNEETTATNVEKPKAKRGRKPGQKAAKRGGKKAPAVKAEAGEETFTGGLNVEGGNIQGDNSEEVNAEGTTVDNNIISEAGVQGEKDEEISIQEAPTDQVSLEETIAIASADVGVTEAGEASVEELKTDAAVTEEAILEETAVSAAVLVESAVGGLTVESAAFDKAPEIEIPVVEEGARAEEVEAEEAKVVLAGAEEVGIGESVVEEAALEHAVVEDAIVDEAVETETTWVEEAQMAEEMVEAVSVGEVGAKDSNTEEAIAEDTASEPKAAGSEVCEAVEEEVAVQQPTRPDVGDTMEDVVDDTTAPTGILAEPTSGETNTTTSVAVEPMGDDTIGSIAMTEAEVNVPEGEIHESEGGQLSAVAGTENSGEASSSVADAAGSDIESGIRDRGHALSSLKRKAKGRLSEPATGNVADSVEVDANHKRRSTGGGLPLPKRRRVTPPPMQPPSTPAEISPSPRKVASPSAESTPRSTGPLTTPVKPLGPFLMPPATPEPVAGIGRSPTKGSTPLKLLSDEADGTMVVTTEAARRRGQEMAQRHLQQYQGVFERLRANFEVSEGFQQAYQGVMRRAFPPTRPSGRGGLSVSSPALLAFEGRGLDDGDDSFDRSFDRAVSPDRSSIIWAWDIEHDDAGSQEAEGESDGDDGDDEDEAGEVIADPLDVEEKASIAAIMDAPRDSNILEQPEVQEVVMSDRPAELELAQELDGAEKLKEVVMTLDNDGGGAEETEEGDGKGAEESEDGGDRGGRLPSESEGPETKDEDFENEAGFPGGETEGSREQREMEIYEDEEGPDQVMEEPEVPAEAQSLMKSEGSVGTCSQVKPSRLRIPAAKAFKLSKAPRIPVPASRVATVKMRKVSVASLKDVPISKMTPYELASTTSTCTARNKLYSCDFTRRVIHKNTPRPPSPNAKAQTLKASQDRARRQAIQEETGILLGPGDEENFDPNPSSKVRWGHPLESQVDYEERKSPSQAKELLPRPSILSRSTQLNRHGNVVTPPTEIVIERTKVTISKILYRGEKK